MPQETGLSELHEEILAIMVELELPAPERMLGRIETMLPKGDRNRSLGPRLPDDEAVELLNDLPRCERGRFGARRFDAARHVEHHCYSSSSVSCSLV